MISKTRIIVGAVVLTIAMSVIAFLAVSSAPPSTSALAEKLERIGYSCTGKEVQTENLNGNAAGFDGEMKICDRGKEVIFIVTGDVPTGGTFNDGLYVRGDGWHVAPFTHFKPMQQAQRVLGGDTAPISHWGS